MKVVLEVVWGIHFLLSLLKITVAHGEAIHTGGGQVLWSSTRSTRFESPIFADVKHDASQSREGV